MKYIIITLMLSLSLTSVHAQSINDNLAKEIETIEKQTKNIKHNLHPEIVRSLPVVEQEAVLALLKSQGEDLKALNTLLRESFNNLDPELQRDILLRLSER